jgi:uncharacterized protein (DUF4415 family)
LKTKRFGEIPDTTDEEEALIQAGIDADPDNPELTAEELANLRPLREILPELAESIRRARGRPAQEVHKRQMTVRLDADIVEALKKDGAGWQTRMNAALRRELGLTGAADGAYAPTRAEKKTA